MYTCMCCMCCNAGQKVVPLLNNALKKINTVAIYGAETPPPPPNPSLMNIVPPNKIKRSSKWGVSGVV